MRMVNGKRFMLCLGVFSTLSTVGAFAAVPESVSIQGTLEAPGGGPLTGTHAYQLRFFNDSTAGSLLYDVTGAVGLSDAGRFSIEWTAEPAILAVTEVWYQLAIDANDDGIDANDVFPERVQIHSVPFALKASESDTLDGLNYSDFAPAGHVHDDNYWRLGGNIGTTAGTHYIGTSDNVALELQVNSSRVLRLEPASDSFNLIGGHSGNTIDPSVVGGTIGGGGNSIIANIVSGDYGTIGGGRGNVASGVDSIVAGGQSNVAEGTLAAIGGGDTNSATGEVTTIAGGQGNQAIAMGATVGGGGGNIASGIGAVISGGTMNSATGTSSTIGGGYNNRAGGTATVGGGTFNAAAANHATVGGGWQNKSEAPLATISGGQYNTARGDYSSIGGGIINFADGFSSTIGGGYGNTIWDASFATIAGGGQSEFNNPTTSNLVTDNYGTIGGGGGNQAGNAAGTYDDAIFATVAGGELNAATNNYTTVSGGSNNRATGYGSSVGGGFHNQAGYSEPFYDDSFTTVAGGYFNTAGIRYASVGGGYWNLAGDTAATVSGGSVNNATARYSAIGGGFGNTAIEQYASVGGGHSNVASGNGATIGGGQGNQAGGKCATIAGGGLSEHFDYDSGNHVLDDYGTIGGGGNNTAGTDDGISNNATYATISGGLANIAGATVASIAGGESNSATATYSTVSGGSSNTAGGSYSTIGGGFTNTAGHQGATIGGGYNNAAMSKFSTVAGGGSDTIGKGNRATEDHATVGGGFNNRASGEFATVIGGGNNSASGYSSTIAGGVWNAAAGQFSFAAGLQAKANHDGSFVWGDSQTADITSTVDDQVTFRCLGGVRFMSGGGGANQTVSWAPGGSSWSFSSDRNLKENLTQANGTEILEKVCALPLMEWNFEGYSPRHMGPMAQDFHAAFALGDSESSIDSGDLHGVALASIQGLYELVQEKESVIAQQAKQIETLKKQTMENKARLERLEALAASRVNPRSEGAR